MVKWLSDNIGNIIIIAIVLVIVALIIVKLVKDKKAGKHCASCPSGGSCPHCNGGCDRKEKADKAKE